MEPVTLACRVPTLSEALLLLIACPSSWRRRVRVGAAHGRDVVADACASAEGIDGAFDERRFVDVFRGSSR